ncbi:hypothetical protein JTE90_019220 [Oedothorax gibbosus]|uniref:TMC domain-containing protein n=1 Tax=Oedothorax gibbosus TaxID=931172 RepID=A0AAV6UEL5_9ARAC|nr:hypothetical protein JTE90_019220 [Oedothorax gibbosus]
MASNERNMHYLDENDFRNYGNQLQEDEYGYVDPTQRASNALISQLPSRHIDDLFSETQNEKNVPSGTLRKRNSQYQRTLQLKNATLNCHNLNIDAGKIYEILSADPNANEEEKLKTLREMHQSLTIKRQVKERLDADRRQKFATRTLGCTTRFKLGMSMAWHKFRHECKNISYFLEPWHSSIKTIQGKFGSEVASYFIFLRWLLYINLWNCFTTFCFVVIPQLLSQYFPNPNSHKNATMTGFSGFDLLTGSGWFSDSLLYFGHYSNEVIEVIPSFLYNMPLAFLLTIGVNSLINLFAVSSSITAYYRKNYVDTAGDIRNLFCNKIFSAWDYAIETENAAELQKQAFCNEIKEILYRRIKDQKRRTLMEKILQKSLNIIVTIFSLAAVVSVGYLTYILLDYKSLTVHVKILEDMTLSLTVTTISSVSYFLLKYATKLEYASKRMKIYFTMCRVVLLRIVMLGIIVYFWMTIYKPPRNMNVCYETELGKEIYRLILVNFLFSLIIFTLIGEGLRKLMSRFIPSLQQPQFDVAYNTLDLIYYQTLAWIAIFCMPLGSLLVIFILILLFYVKKSTLSSGYRPAKRSLSINEAHTFYLTLTFIMFFFAAFTVGYSIFGTEPSDCGPFRDYKWSGNVLKNVFLGKSRNFLTTLIGYITSPGVLFALFCALGLVVYYMRAKAKAHIAVIKKIREQLMLATKDKAFLLKLFDEAFCAQMQSKPSTNSNGKSKELNEPHRRKPKQPEETQPEIVFNEGYSDYSYRPVESPIRKKFDLGYTPANVPVNNPTDGSPMVAHNSSHSRVDGLRPSPRRGSSPLQTRKGPSHQHGFRHWGTEDTPNQSFH